MNIFRLVQPCHQCNWCFPTTPFHCDPDTNCGLNRSSGAAGCSKWFESLRSWHVCFFGKHEWRSKALMLNNCWWGAQKWTYIRYRFRHVGRKIATSCMIQKCKQCIIVIFSHVLTFLVHCWKSMKWPPQPRSKPLGSRHGSPSVAQCKNELAFTWDSSIQEEEV